MRPCIPPFFFPAPDFVVHGITVCAGTPLLSQTLTPLSSCPKAELRAHVRRLPRVGPCLT